MHMINRLQKNTNLMQKIIRWVKSVVHMVNGVGKNSAGGGAKNWAGPFFPHHDKFKHQPCAEGYQVRKTCCAYCKWGGEKLS